MARVGWGRHSTVVTGSNDATKQVSVNAWNADITTSGMFGFTSSTVTVSTNTITPTDSFTVVNSGGTINLITNTNFQDKDILFLLDGGGGAILAHNQIASGSNEKIILLSGINKTLSATVPTVLYRLSGVWYEFLINSDIMNSNINANAAISPSKMDTTSDYKFTVATVGSVYKDTQTIPQAWRITTTNYGELQVADIGDS